MPEVLDGPAIRRAYEAKGLTRQKFADLVDLSPRSITNITGTEGVCSRAAAARIADALGWKVGDVIEDASGAVTATESEAAATEAPAEEGPAAAGAEAGRLAS